GLLVVDWKAGKVLRRFGPSRDIPFLGSFGAVWSPDGRYVALGDRQELLLLEAETGEEGWKIADGKRPIKRFACSPDGRWFVTAGYDSTVDLRETHGGEIARTFAGHRGEVTALAFAPDGRSFASGGADTTAIVWDLFAAPFGQVEKLT